MRVDLAITKKPALAVSVITALTMILNHDYVSALGIIAAALSSSTAFDPALSGKRPNGNDR